MQYSLAALRALLLGLAGSCQVAAFGTLPDLDALKDAKIGTRGETAGGTTLGIKLDQNFCTNAISKNYLGTDYCGSITSLGPGACGSGSDVYRTSDNNDDKYDVCQWRDGKCDFAGYSYMCGSQCFPTAESISESTNNAQCDAGKVFVECGPAGEPPVITDCVSTDYTARCDHSLVGEFDPPGSNNWVVKDKWQISLTDAGNRRRELEARELSTGCTPACKGIISTTPDGPNRELVVEEKCSCGTVGSGVSCSCATVSSIVITDTTSQITAQDASICQDVTPQWWGWW
jgi:hypothetical protein